MCVCVCGGEYEKCTNLYRSTARGSQTNSMHARIKVIKMFKNYIEVLLVCWFSINKSCAEVVKNIFLNGIQINLNNFNILSAEFTFYMYF